MAEKYTKTKKPSLPGEIDVESANPKVVEERYCFPDYGIAVDATSPEEAEEKLKEILEKNKK